MDIKCFLIEPTGKYTDWENNSKSPIYRRVDTGEENTMQNFGVGAIWDADWYHDVPKWCGSDGKSYCVETPGGTWAIDTEASNCTRKGDVSHKCWCRHGIAPNLTVNKVGETCSAGAGSIMIGNYHGFLINGILTSC